MTLPTEMKRRADFVLQNVGGQDLLVPLGGKVMEMNALVLLNATARCIWELLAEDRSLEDLVGAIAERFDVGKEEARADVRTFLDYIAQFGLLEK